MDELAQTQLLKDGNISGRTRFRDIGRTPSPLQNGFDTASQINELMQSSFDDRSLTTPESPEIQEKEHTSGSDGELTDDDESGALPRPATDAVSGQASASVDGNESRQFQTPSPQPQTVDNAAFAEPTESLSTTVNTSTAPEPGSKSPSLSTPSPASSPLAPLPPATSPPTSTAIGPSAVPRSHASAVAEQSNNLMKKIVAIPSVLPRSNSISAISTRFYGKLAERRNSGTIARTTPVTKPQPKPAQSADSSDNSEGDSDSDSDSSPEQDGGSKARRIGLAALQ